MIDCLASPQCLTLPLIILIANIAFTKQKFENKVRLEFKRNIVHDLKKVEKSVSRMKNDFQNLATGKI